MTGRSGETGCGERSIEGDDAVADLIERERRRRSDAVQLVASETVATPAVRAALASGLDAKYAEGYPGARFHGGCEVVDELEKLAVGRATTLFGADYVNVQPLSGSVANLAVIAAFAQPGDPILALSLGHGGHQTHGSRANFSGRWFTPLRYGVRRDDELIDYDQIRELALVHRPRILVAGATSYSRNIDYAALRAIADEAEAILWVDAAHTAGLVAAGVAPSPVPHADVVTAVTHKVLRGPRGGIILAAGRHASALQKAVFPFIQGGPAMNVIAGKAICFAESAQPDFADYAAAAVRAAQRLSDELGQRGLRVVSGGTDIHLAVVDVTSTGLTGLEAQQRLDAAGIVVDKAVLPFDPQPPSQGSAIRFGTPAAVLAGLDESAMSVLADAIVAALAEPLGSPRHAAVRATISELLSR